jgi:hypothetical protein
VESEENESPFSDPSTMQIRKFNELKEEII